MAPLGVPGFDLATVVISLAIIPAAPGSWVASSYTPGLERMVEAVDLAERTSMCACMLMDQDIVVPGCFVAGT